MDADKVQKYMEYWRNDWCAFAYDVLKARLDKEQQDIIYSVQYNRMTAVASGTARGKDFTSACACLCFMYLTPRWVDGNLVENTKVAMTAPTDRQIKNIMVPEVRRLLRNAPWLPGRQVAYDIRTNYEEWYLTGFKAGDDNTEAWSGFHAVNTMFAITEASGISDSIYNAIEGNLQGNSRILLVFNPNVTTGYAARAMKSDRFKHFRLNSLNAENVVKKKQIIPGQVDYEWVQDKVNAWCEVINENDFNEGEGDFHWEGAIYRPNDLFRVKVLGMFPKVSEDILVPLEWIEIANRRWIERRHEYEKKISKVRIGVDVAGMGRDSSVLCPRYGDFVDNFKTHQSGGKADHMLVAGMVVNEIKSGGKAFIDTIGEGAGVYSRLEELGYTNIFSVKFSESARRLHDTTEQYEFINMRAYLLWCIRDWLNPKNNNEAMLPPCDQLAEELTEIHWMFASDGRIKVEPKEDIKERLKRSPDFSDALANTFYPNDWEFDDEALLKDLV